MDGQVAALGPIEVPRFTAIASNQHLLPAFGGMRLDRITARDVEHVKAGLLDRGLSRKRVNDILNVISKILKYAEELEGIEKPKT